MSWADDFGMDAFDGEFFDNHDGIVTEIDSHLFKRAGHNKEAQLYNRLNGYTHTNRNNEEVDVRKINRRYATNLYYWYWERAKLSMNESSFNATLMGSILFTKKRM